MPAPHPILSRLPLLVLPLLLFAAFFHWQMLDITNAGWLLRNSDNGENALGLHAWLHDPAPGLWRTYLLNAPEGVGLLFTDSNPLLSLLAFPFRGVLPADAQLIGWWVLACLFLQCGFAWALLRPYAPNALTLWCGVLLLAALPTFFTRHVHVNLMAHGLILWALWRFLQPDKARSNAGWAVLIGITTLVHSYLLVMVAAIWASAMLERFWKDRAGIVRQAAECAAILAMVIVLAWLLGALESHRSSDSYGAFGMPLDALWNPSTTFYSTFAPVIQQRGGRDFEGFQYLGLGLLILLPAAAFLAFRLPRPAADAPDSLSRLGWLVPALIVLTLLAIGSHPDFAGRNLFGIALPPPILHALDAVRASGRLFWPVAYTLVWIALRIAYRLPPQHAARALLLLAGVQAVDMVPMAASIRFQNGEAARSTAFYVRTPSPEWDALIAGSRDITFVPWEVERDLARFQEIAWRAAKLGVPVRSVYAARQTRASLDRHAQEAAAFAAGRLVPGRLYLINDGALIPEPYRMRVRWIDGIATLRTAP